MNKKHDNVINGGSLKGTLFLGLALVAVAAFKVLVVNNMWGGYNMQEPKDENAYIFIEIFNFNFRYKKKNIIFSELFDELDGFYYIGIYYKIENKLIFIKKFNPCRYFLQPLKFESVATCRAYCEEISELLKNGIIKSL